MVDKDSAPSSARGFDAVLATGGEVGRLMRDIDWSKTPLGPVDGWRQSLRSAASICLSSRFPIVMYWGAEYTVLYNDAYSHILGSKHPWALGRTCAETWAEIWDTIGPMLDNVVATGEATWSDDLELDLSRSGVPEECYFSFSFSPVRVEDGSIGGVFTAVVETTQRVLSDRRLRLLAKLSEQSAGARSAEEACRRCVDALAGSRPVPVSLIYLCDDRNQARLAASSGLAPDSPLLVEVVGLDDAEGRFPFARANSAAEPVGIPIEAADLEGAGGWANDVPPIRALVLPIGFAEPGRPVGYLVAGMNPLRPFDADYRAFFDLVARQVSSAIADAEAYAAERMRAEALIDLDRAKTAFFSNVSHEFRTPLTLLLGPLETLQRELGADPAQARHVELAHRNAMRLLKLVNTLLDFSRMEALRGEAELQPVELGRFTAELASVFRSAVEGAGLRFEVDCAPLDEPVDVDPEMWEKIVLNLISNALKFTLEGSISVRLVKRDANAVLIVADTGIGIDAGALQHIFDRFYRVRGVEARTHEGAGIGLSLVKEMVEFMGGTVGAASAPGAGTVIEVSLPVAAARAPAVTARVGGAATGFVAEAMGWIESVLPPDSAAAGTAARGGRVLLVDDNADMRSYLQNLLSAHWDVEGAADGVEALEAIRRQRPDLVLTDVMMPRMDGFELLAALRADPSTRDLPVVILSARAGEDAAIEGFAKSADDYLVKPFTAQELVARVSANIALSRVRAELADAKAEVRLVAERAAFLNMAAHELRSPLTVIGGFVALILNGSIDPASELAREALEKVAIKTRETARLVDQMLLASRMEAGAIEVTVADVDLKDVAREAVARSSDLAGLESANIVLTLPQQPVRVTVDPTLAGLIVDNLITNAILHGSSPISIEVSSSPPRVTVVDSGAGVPDEVRDRIFDPYFQVEGQLRGRGGAGLGLAVSRRLAHIQGGSLVLDESEAGARFTLTLPESTGRHVEGDAATGEGAGRALYGS